MASLAIGVGAGVFCYFAVRLRAKIRLDDSLDVVGVHGVGGTWGALATGLFASASIGGVDGLFYGEPDQFVKQLIAVGATIAYSGVVTYIILKVLDLVMGLRVSEEEEVVGLDVSQHGERGYILDGGSGYAGIPVASTNGSAASQASPTRQTPSEATS
jgi:Amt family ammonium transporter